MRDQIPGVCFFTIVSRNYIHFARTLMNSIAKNYQNADLVVCLCDEAGDFDFSEDTFSILNIRSLDNIPDIDSFIFKYTILELNTAIKPYVFEKLFGKQYRKVIYFDPDIKVYGPLDEMVSLLDNHNVLLTPHITGLLDDGKNPSELDILRSGTYNLGFIGMRNNHDTRTLVNWWQSKLYDHCVVNLEAGLFVDQKWIDLVPGMFPKVMINRNTGWNIAYWNLNHRNFTKNEDGFFVDGNPLVFFHFSGYSPRDGTLSKHQNRFSQKSAGTQVHDLCKNYKDDLIRNGFKQCAIIPYAFSNFHGGPHIPDMARRIYRDEFYPEKHSRKNIWSEEGSREFINYLNKPATLAGINLSYITKISYRLYSEREDLISAFPDLLGSNGVQYAHWFADNARPQTGLDRCFITPVTNALELLKKSHKKGDSRVAIKSSYFYSVLYRIAYRLRILARPFVSPEVRYIIRVRLLKKAHSGSIETGSTRPSQVPSKSHKNNIIKYPFGVNLYGYVHAESGVGQSARSNMKSLTSAQIPLSVIDFRDANISRMRAVIDESLKGEAIYSINLFQINADQIVNAFESLGFNVLKNRYNIGYWAWELPEFPDEYTEAENFLDEIWTPSSFCQKAISDKLSIPVKVIPHAVWRENGLENMDRGKNDIIDLDNFTFIMMFDCLSVPARKNVFGTIEAFKKAFGKHDASVNLVIKISNLLKTDKSFQTRFHKAINGFKNIKLYSGYLHRSEVLSMLRGADCFISLHRSEGFGLGIAEAMMLEKPVIVTGWSGNMDFCNDQNAFLVNYTLTKIPKDYGPYKKGKTWAEPDIEHAASLMRHVFRNPEISKQKASVANHFVSKELSPSRIGLMLEDRLKEIYAEYDEIN